MGATFGSIHVRTTDRNRIHAALTTLASETNQRFLLGPEYNGWIAIYPQDAGQDPSVSKSLARNLKLPTLHLLVHDDDIFAYFYYRDGALIDEYDSCPDYFGDVDEPTRERKRGRPHLLRELLPPRKSVEDLDNILHPPGGEFPVFSSERAHAFASVLKLTNALTSYEYLTDGDRDGIKGWRKFTHVPDLAAERKEKQSKAAAIRREKAELRKDDRLLLELKSPPGGMFPAAPIFAPAADGGFFLAWSQLDDADGPLFRATPAGLEETGLRVPQRIHVMSCSPCGRYLALGCASGRWEAQLWDLHQRRQIKSIPHDRAVQLATFSRDGRTLLTGDSNGQITFTETESAREIFTAQPSPDIRAGAIHPSGNHAVVYGNKGLCIYDLATRTFQVRLVHGPHDPFILLDPIMAQMLREFERQAQKGWPNAEERVGELRLSRQRILDAHQGKPTPIARESSEQMFAMAFNPEGALLACANTGGLRVYGWDELLASRYQTPPPRFSIDAGESPDEADAAIGVAYTYDVHFNKSSQNILSCGGEGTVKSLDLATGSSRVILRPPQLGPLWRIGLSSDDSLLALTYKPVFSERTPKTKWLFQIWNYPRLA